MRISLISIHVPIAGNDDDTGTATTEDKDISIHVPIAGNDIMEVIIMIS